MVTADHHRAPREEAPFEPRRASTSRGGSRPVKRVLKVYMERPELVALVVLVALVGYFTLRSGGLFLSYQNLRGILGLFPELSIMALGFALLMIAGEFDLSIGSVFGLAPIVLCAARPAFRPALLGVLRRRPPHVRRHRIAQRIHFAHLRHPELHRDARHAVHVRAR